MWNEAILTCDAISSLLTRNQCNTPHAISNLIYSFFHSTIIHLFSGNARRQFHYSAEKIKTGAHLRKKKGVEKNKEKRVERERGKKTQLIYHEISFSFCNFRFFFSYFPKWILLYTCNAINSLIFFFVWQQTSHFFGVRVCVLCFGRILSSAFIWTIYDFHLFHQK